MSGHIAPARSYVLIFALLMVFTAITVAVAFTNLGAFNFPVAISIAIVKATLVILFFMHLRYDRLFHTVVFVSAICAASLFVGFTWMDTGQYQQTNIWHPLSPYSTMMPTCGRPATPWMRLSASVRSGHTTG